MTKLLYRTGHFDDFKWRLVATTAADIGAKRVALFNAGYTTMIKPDDYPLPDIFNPIGAWPGRSPGGSRARAGTHRRPRWAA